MQKIVHTDDYYSIHPIFDELEKFYYLTSTKAIQENKLLKPTFDESFRPLNSLFYRYGSKEYSNYDIGFIDKKYEKLILPEFDDKNLILLFSGGKDSSAAILYYQKQGYKIHLFHVLGINKAYPDEWSKAQKIADYFNLPIHYEKISFQGKNEFPEHPMKNIILGSLALQWGIKNNIGIKVACGNYATTGIDRDGFHVNGSDSILMWEAYEHIITTILPEYKMYVDLKDEGHTYDLLIEYHELIKMCQSCMGAHRFREWNKKNNEEKYGIKLMPNRCGSCWKCAVEYIYLADHNIYEYNEEYYKKCLKILLKDAKMYHDSPNCNIIELWDFHFKYPIEKSKYKDILSYK